MAEPMRLVISGDFLSVTSEEQLMALGLNQLWPHRTTLAWEFMPTVSEELPIERGQLDSFDALILRGQPLTAAALTPAAQARLLAVARAGAGYDKVDLAACTAADVVVFTTPDAFAQATAFGAFALLVAVAKKLRVLDRLVREGRWDERGDHIGADVHGQTLGIIGPGRIGREVVRLAAPLGMRALAYSPHLTAERAATFGALAVPLDTLLAEADFVCVTCALTNETRSLLDARRLALLKPTAYLINVARGAVIDQPALTEALAEGRLAGAALDVFAAEPLPPDDPLTRLDNVLLTPHAVSGSPGANRQVFRDVVEGLLSLQRGEIPPHVVNPAVLQRPGFQAKLASCSSQRTAALSRGESLPTR